jgi:predicted O-methyltransferase YrrM
MIRQERAMTSAVTSAVTNAVTSAAEIDGWLTEDQAAMLADAASTCPADGEIVEIGSFRGKSTIVLARAAPEGAAIVAIDPHAGNDRGPHELDGYTREAAADRAMFEQNLVAAGVRHRVRHVAEFSDRAHGAVHGTIDVLYIDGAHRYRPARADIRQWGARVGDGGTMLIHDSFSSVGVTLAILRELVPGRRFRYVGRSRSLARYRADLGGGTRGRVCNGARQLAQLGWFARNVTLKVALRLGAGRLLTRLGRAVPDWPY